jgi:hypothetical protein
VGRARGAGMAAPMGPPARPLRREGRVFRLGTRECSPEQPSHKPQPLVQLITLPPRHFASPAKAEKCYLCVRNDLLPFCQEGHFVERHRVSVRS